MANELVTSYATPGSTLYCIARRVSDAYAWNDINQQFEAWSNTFLAEYAISLTESGGDLWLGDFPSAIAAGTYAIFYYVQAGATPATTDTILSQTTQQWDGAALSSSSSVTLSAYALTSLASAKRFLHIASSASDTLLTEIINGMSARIERIAGRNFAARDYYQWQNAVNNDVLSLKQYPVISINRIAYGRADAIGVYYDGPGIRATIQVTDSMVRLRTVATTGAATNTDIDITNASYATTSLVADAINAVSGWHATLAKNAPSRELHPVPGVNCQSLTARLTYPDTDDIEYTFDSQTGLVAFKWKPPFLTPLNNPNFYYAQPYVREYGQPGLMYRGHQGFLIQYRAGYETVPDDLSLLTNELVAEAYNLSKRDTTTRSENLGDYGYSLADMVAMTEGQLARIRNYGASRIPMGAGI